MKKLTVILMALMSALFCGGEGKEPDVPGLNFDPDGMVVSVELPAIDEVMAGVGKKEFDRQCVTCHKMDRRLIGPPLDGITLRRKPEWIMNMMLKTARMLREDEVAKELLKEYKIQMTQAQIKPNKARAVLEYLRQNDAKFK